MEIVQRTPEHLVIRQEARTARTAIMAAGALGLVVTIIGVVTGLTPLVLTGAVVVAVLYAAWAFGFETMTAQLDKAAGTARIARLSQRARRDETVPLADILPPPDATDPEREVQRRLQAAVPLAMTPYTTTAQVPRDVARAILDWAG